VFSRPNPAIRSGKTVSLGYSSCPQSSIILPKERTNMSSAMEVGSTGASQKAFNYFQPSMCSSEAVDKELKELSGRRKAMFRSTPFDHFLNMAKMPVDNDILDFMVENFNVEASGFKLGDVVVPFTPTHVSSILGLKNGGIPVDMTANTTAIRGGQLLQRDHMKRLIADAKNSTDDAEFIRLLLCLLFSHFLFYDGSRRTKTWFVLVIEHLQDLDTYDWTDAVFQFLVAGLAETSVLLKKRKSAGNMCPKTGQVTGCVAILQVWLGEHLKITTGIPRSIPLANRWASWIGGVRFSKKLRSVGVTLSKIELGQVDLIEFEEITPSINEQLDCSHQMTEIEGGDPVHPPFPEQRIAVGEHFIIKDPLQEEVNFLEMKLLWSKQNRQLRNCRKNCVRRTPKTSLWWTQNCLTLTLVWFN